MKKIFFIVFLVLAFASSTVYAAKYSINTSGTVKSNGKVVSPPQATTQTQNYSVPAQPQNYGTYSQYSSPNPYQNYGINQNYNVYNAQPYVSSNQVNVMPVQNIELVMDYSGSMYNWISAAKSAMAAIIAQIPQTTSVGFRVFGHDYNGTNPNTQKALAIVNKIVKVKGKYKVQTKPSPIGNSTGTCTATKQVTRIVPANSAALLAGMNSVDIGGSTPMVYALDRAINEDFALLDRTSPKKIVLITDGGENCGGDPCEYAKQLVKTRRDIHVDVVLVSHSSDASLQCLADRTGGNLYRINDISQFKQTVSQSMSTQPQEIPQQYYEYYEE